MRRGVTGLLVALLLVLALPSAGAAQTPLPVGEARGVRIVREQGALVVVFTQRAEKLRRRVAGKLVTVVCTQFLEGGTGVGEYTLRAPRRGRRLNTGDLTPGIDYCRVYLAARTVRRDGERGRIRRRPVVSVPLTQAGAVHLDEQAKTRMLLVVLTLAEAIGQERNISGYPTAAELFDAVPELRPGPERSPVVALDSPSGTPEGRAVGYYSDGDRHVAAVIVSRSGRRLFLEYEGDVLHTNVAGYLFNPLD
jgi:hypothetical protein